MEQSCVGDRIEWSNGDRIEWSNPAPSAGFRGAILRPAQD